MQKWFLCILLLHLCRHCVNNENCRLQTRAAAAGPWHQIYHTVNRLRSFLSLGHSVTRSLGHSVTRSLGHSVTRSLSHLVTWSLGHLITWSLDHSVTWSLGHSVTIFNITTNWLTDWRTTLGLPGLLRRQISHAQKRLDFRVGSDWHIFWFLNFLV